MAQSRQAARPLGRRREGLDRRGRGQVARLAAGRRRADRRTCRQLQAFQDEVKQAGFKHVLLLGHGRIEPGPGGACGDVRRQPGFPELLMLDSTDPRRSRALAAQGRSGEDAVHRQQQVRQHARAEHLQGVFLGRMTEGGRRQGRASISSPSPIPGSKMQKVAEGDGFRHIFFGDPPSAAATRCCRTSAWCRRRRWGSTSRRSSTATALMVRSCARRHAAGRATRACSSALLLGEAAQGGARQGDHRRLARASPMSAPGSSSCWPRAPASSGKGIVPVDGEPLGPPEVYGTDRVFAYLRHRRAARTRRRTPAVAALEAAGHPVVRIDIDRARCRSGRLFYPVGVRHRGCRRR